MGNLSVEQIGMHIFEKEQARFPSISGKLIIYPDNNDKTCGRVCASGWNKHEDKFMVIFNEKIFWERFNKYGYISQKEQIIYVQASFLHEFFHSETNAEESLHSELRDLFCHECDIKLVDAFPLLKPFVLKDWPTLEEDRQKVLTDLEYFRSHYT